MLVDNHVVVRLDDHEGSMLESWNADNHAVMRLNNNLERHNSSQQQQQQQLTHGPQY